MLYNNEIFYLCCYENSDRGSYNIIENDPSIDSNNTFAQHIQVLNPITDALKLFYLKHCCIARDINQNKRDRCLAVSVANK